MRHAHRSITTVALWIAGTAAGLAAPPGSIGGRVLDPGGAPLVGIPVQVHDVAGTIVAAIVTDAAGSYSSGPYLAAGSYYVRTVIDAEDRYAPAHFDRLYDGASCDPVYCFPHERGTPVTVTASVETAGIDLTLPRGGRISGTVRHGRTGAGVPATIGIFDADGFPASVAVADETGAYTSAKGLPTGLYTVAVIANRLGLVNEIYDDVCALCEPVADALPIAVTAGATTAGIDFVLEPGGSISGRLSSPSGVARRELYVYTASGRSIDFLSTDESGAYDSASPTRGMRTGLPSGEYFVRASGGAFHDRGPFDLGELYDDIPCPGWNHCDPAIGNRVRVYAPYPTTGIDFALAVGGAISGRVEDPFGYGLAGATITVWNASGEFLAQHRGDGFGYYYVPRLSSGDYYVGARVDAAGAGSGFVAQVYPGISCPGATCELASGTPVRVTRGLYTSGIDFTLLPGAQIAGSITDAVTERPLNLFGELYDEFGLPAGQWWADGLGPGGYVSTPLTPSKHHARTYDWALRPMPRYRSRLYDGRDCGMYGSCDPRLGAQLALGDGVREGVDFRLLRQRRQSDFDDDRQTDPAVFEPATGTWRVWSTRRSRTQAYVLTAGAAGAVGVTGDFDGDNRSDAAAYHPATGTWVIRDRYEGTLRAIPLGGPSELPVPSDYDGDGKVDVAVFEPASGTWKVRASATGAVAMSVFGAGEEPMPVPGDYDGDGKSDLAVYERGPFRWRILESASGVERVDDLSWATGCAECVAAPGDYDDDGRQDLALFAPGSATWRIRRSSDGAVIVLVHGDVGGRAVAGDYNRDGRTDPATYLESSGQWTVLPSGGRPVLVIALGGPGQVPVF